MILIGISTILLAISTINHRLLLKKESEEFKPKSNMVRIDDNDFHVFTQGEGDKTLVFMAGHGTTNPTLDFKPLWEKLVDEYRVVVVEKAGYGWSDASKNKRDLDTMLEETRKALDLAGVEGPFILVPHSMSGLEGIYWSQKYPEEIKAIIGLDPCTPGAVDILPEIDMTSIYFMRTISNLGITRLIPDSEIGLYFPLLDTEFFTQEEKDLYLLPFYRNYFSKNMINEIKYLDENAQIVRDNEIPSNTPMYFFISNDQENNATGWNKALKEYVMELNNGKYMELDTGHYVHYEKSDRINEEIREFISNLK